MCFTLWIEYLREIETKLKNTLACLSGARLGLTHEINGGRKSRDTLPIKKEKLNTTTNSRNQFSSSRLIQV